MKLVKGDIIRNPWVSDPKWRDFERFTKVGHSVGFDTMLREVYGEEAEK